MSQRPNEQQIDQLPDLGELVSRHAVSFVKQRPVSISLWVLGLLLAAFATGFSVNDDAAASYRLQLDMAHDVEAKELNKAMRQLQAAEQEHYNKKGWFWQCDRACQQAKDKVGMAQDRVNAVVAKRDKILKEGRREVGIWSKFGVKDIRDSFWEAWAAGKAMAARMTMMDAFFMMMPGSREESFASTILKLVMQYVINLTLGLITSFFFFIYSAYCLTVAYGEPFMSGLAFFLLVLVAGTATVGSYLFAIYGTICGGGYYLVKQAAKQAAMQDGQRQRPRQVNYGAAGARYGRAHAD